MSRLIIIGPGRAGMSLGLAARTAGHSVVAVGGRSGSRTEAAQRLDATDVPVAGPFPNADLAIVAVRDDAIAAVAAEAAPGLPSGVPVVHLSGLTRLDALDAVAANHPVGSFHPLQTLPTPEAGAVRLAGAWVGITTEDGALADLLRDLAASLGMHPFDIADDRKATYHAAAAAAANFPLVSLVMAEELFGAAGVPFAAAQPLVDAVVANAFAIGPRASITGPVARGDVRTVTAQMVAVARDAPSWSDAFAAAVRSLAATVGRSEEFADVVGGAIPPAEAP